MKGHKKPLMVLSVDVEALPARASDEHVEKLIWGSFRGEKSYGLREMMEEAEAFNAPLTCLLDYAEKDLYGKQIDNVAKEIKDSGHDLELHLHPEILTKDFWQSRGLDKPKIAPNRWDDKTARVPFEHFVGQFFNIKGEVPTAFRAGSFRSNSGQISAMGEIGIPISSNMAHSVYLAQGRSPIGSAHDDVYTHSNSVLELPITQLEAKNDGHVNLEFPWRGRAKQAPGEAFEWLANSGRSIVVLLLHSWVLLERPQGSKGFFGPGKEDNRAAFRQMLEAASEHFEFTSFEEIARTHLDDLRKLSRRNLNKHESTLVSFSDVKSEGKKDTGKVSFSEQGSAMINLKKDREERTYGIVIGGMRCGSTASFKNLSQHPQVCPADNKEVHFFSSEENWAKGYEWYRSQWSQFDPTKHKVCVEATTHYSKFPVHKDVPRRMSEIGQDIRIIYSVRDPIERAESHLAFQLSKGYLDNKDREKFLLGTASRYSSYFYQAEQYLKLFKEDNIHVVVQEEMKNNPDNVFPGLFSFLGIDDSFKPESKLLNSRGSYINPREGEGEEDYYLSQEEKRSLYDLLREDVLRFSDRFNVDIGFWKTFSSMRGGVS